LSIENTATRDRFFDGRNAVRRAVLPQLIGRTLSINDPDGRAGGFVEAATFTPAIYRLTFATGEYYRTRDVNSFYPTIAIEFQVSSTSEHYHVPLLLSPHGYTTYRGS